jgi:hypothetical protein
VARKIIDIMGQRFGRLFVVALARHDQSAGIIWNCRCDCGSCVNVAGTTLRSGGKQSCGCLASEVGTKLRKAPGVTGFSKLFNSYLRGARQRGYEFALTREQFATLTKSNCFYCGVPPSQVSMQDKGKTTEETRQHSAHIYNGVDRVCNDKGYTITNCVACCNTCNMMKRAWSDTQFVCQRVSRHWASKTEMGVGYHKTQGETVESTGLGIPGGNPNDFKHLGDIG